MLVTLDGVGSLHLQLYRALRAAILSGRLAPGARLPSTRALAREADVARITVMLGFEQLRAEGYAVSRKGSGTYVAAELPADAAFSARPGARPVTLTGGVTPRLSSYGRRIVSDRSGAPSWAPRATPLPYDFRYGQPAFADFPHATWRRLLARRARRVSAPDLDYGPTAGAPPLRAAIAEYLQRSRAVACSAEQIMVVGGSQQALDLTARVLLDPGDRVLLEEPHYAGARRVFTAAGATVMSAPVGTEGLNVATLGAAARRVRLAYVTPSHQFPTGVIMSLTCRLGLLAWAERVNAHVLEDDYDSEYRYGGRPVESLQGLDRAGRVLYAGTFSKLMFPALRLGYLVLPEPLITPFLTAKALASIGTAGLEQLALADFITGGHFERHLRRTRARNAARRAALLTAIDEHLGDRVEVSGANAGVHLLLWVRGIAPSRTAALIERAAAVGVGVYAIEPYYLGRPPRAGLLLGYASLTEEEIRTGVRRLASVIR